MKRGLFAVLTGIMLLAWGCGQRASPQGGPRDKTPPTVTSTLPLDSTLNYSGNSVKFTFSEPIRKPTYGKEIFISPFIKRPKITLSDNARRLRIDFQEDLRPQTTYLITLNEIQDNTEGNPLAETRILAFSTGDQLDSMEIKGRLISPEIGKTEGKMTILLFDADSIVDDNFFNVRPAYITQSTEQGDFSFKYLRNAPYRALGLSDADQSNTYNNPADRLAISPDSLITFEEDSTNFTTVKLYAFQPDNVLPRLTKLGWITDSTLKATFNKGLRLDGLKVFSTDTLDQDSQRIETFTYLQKEKVEVLFHVPQGRQDWQKFSFLGLEDSLGKVLDTTLIVRSISYDSASKPILHKIDLLVEKSSWEFYSPKLFRQQADWFILTDTARGERRDTLKYAVENQGFRLRLRPAPEPDSIRPYLLFASKEIAATKIKDTLTYAGFNLSWFNPKAFGKLSGSVRLDSIYSPPIIMHLLNDKKQVVRTVFDTTFSFSFLPAGTYSTQIIFDNDSNGVWTPGSLKERRLAEQIFTPSGTVDIRENWSYPDFIVEVGFAKPDSVGPPKSEDGQSIGLPEKEGEDDR